jgi:hypothetical protein
MYRMTISAHDAANNSTTLRTFTLVVQTSTSTIDSTSSVESASETPPDSAAPCSETSTPPDTNKTTLLTIPPVNAANLACTTASAKDRDETADTPSNGEISATDVKAYAAFSLFGIFLIAVQFFRKKRPARDVH